MSANDAPPVSSGKVRVSYPARPLRDEELADLLAQDRVDEVWVPTGRARSVSTVRGREYSGDILKFVVEFPEKYVAVEYGPPHTPDGLAWYRPANPPTKDELVGEMLAAEVRDGYRRLSERLNPDAHGGESV